MFHRFRKSHRIAAHWSMAAGGGGPFSGRPGRGGPFGRHRGGPFGGRGPRMFDPGALRLVVLGLIAEEPRHGYDIIKALEAKFQGAYSPSPGAIYPMLQMLEEADLVVSQPTATSGSIRLPSRAKPIWRARGRTCAHQRADRRGLGRRRRISLGDEVRAVAKAVFVRLRRGQFTPEQARKARDILKKARRDIEDL